MRNARSLFNVLFILFLTIAAVVGLFWANLNFVKHVPGGADFIVPWKAMQNFMMSGVTPYGELTSLNIQNLIYKRPLVAGQYPYHVNIPLFMLIIFLPLSWIKDISLARAIWMVMLELSFSGVVYFTLRLVRWKPHWIFLVFILIFCSLWLPSISMLVMSTSIIMQAFLICAALLSIELGSDELGGALIGLSLVNIEATGMVLLLLIFWIFSTQRWRILGGFLMMLIVLLGISFLLLPGWFLPFMGSTLSNWQSGVTPSTFKILEGWLPGIGRRLAQILAAGALAVILIEWRAVRGQNVRWLFWTVCFTAAVTPLLGLPFFPHWLAFTLPAMLLVVAAMVQRWKLLGFVSSILAMLGIFAGLWSAQIFGLTSVFILFYPILLTLLLYWVRWGAIRQPRMWADEFSLKG
jgi:hypothetical protein